MCGRGRPRSQLTASRQTKSSNPARVIRRALLEIIAYVPNCAVVARINRGLRIVLPAHRILRGFAFDQYGFAQGQLPERIFREPRRKALAGKVRRSPK